MKTKLILMVMGNERLQIMKETTTSSDRKVNSPIDTRFGHFPLFVISEVFISWGKEI
jgi:hypothetical protein